MYPLTDAAVIKLSCDLIARESISPEDAGCQAILLEHLENLGFEHLELNAHDTKNFYAWRDFGGQSRPELMFAGHTDVVPPGPLDQWQTPPFEPQVIEDYLCGRGAADMKGSLAAMIGATSYVVDELETDRSFSGRLSFLVTSDEEADATYGTQHAIGELVQRNIRPDYCVIGEPSSSAIVGDTVRCGRRGSISAELLFKGIQGHVAYPDDALNPIHTAAPALTALTQKVWDEGNAYYPPTSLQISNIQAGTGANNVIPGELHVLFNLRFSTEQSATGIKESVAQLLDQFELKYEIQWHLSGLPFLTPEGALTDAVSMAIAEINNIEPELSTSGGTSDGRFIAPWSEFRNIDGAPHAVDVVELGPSNATIHKIDERVHTKELSQLTAIYASIVRKLLAPSTC
ncbi:MAG: succinyl-diaminopimelate desuccinylase [Pseudomonadota bacterium]